MTDPWPDHDAQRRPCTAPALETRRWLRAHGGAWTIGGFVGRLERWSVVGLRATLVLRFGVRDETPVAQPPATAMIEGYQVS